MICPNCGSKVKQIVVSLDGKRLYACTSTITTLPVEGRNTRLSGCKTIVDEKGRPFGGSVQYRTGGKIREFRAG